VSTFRLYLWKEWREQRAALVALAILLPVLVALVGFQLPRGLATSTTFVGVVAALSVVLVLIVIGGELLGGDRRREVSWLERLPRGLSAAFPAKLLVFVATTAMALAAGLTLGFTVAELRGGFLGMSFQAERDLEHLLLTVGYALAVAPWAFATSAWCPRGPLALAAGALVACGLGLPLLVLPFTAYVPTAVELALGVTLFLAGALVSAWIGFTAQAHGASLRSIALRGGGSGCLAFAPLWGWGLVQLHERDALELGAPECEIEHAWVSRDGRVAVIEARMHFDHWASSPRSRTLWIDLERGDARELPIPNPSFHAAGSARKPGGLSEYTEFIIEGLDDTLVLDACTGQHLEPPSTGGYTEVSSAGLGVSYWGEDYEAVYHDPFLDLELGRAEAGIALGEAVWIGPEGWWIEGDGWRTFDPRSGTSEPAEWLVPLALPFDMLADGRLIGLLGDGSLGLADPRTRAVTPVLGARSAADVEILASDLQSRDERILADERAHYRLDATCGELSEIPLVPGDWPLRRLDDGDLVLLTSEGFVRLDAEEGTRTPLARFDAIRHAEVTP